ncbi:hypothetical protein JQ616_31190 [Bradyrhizobium tropiciagri]|uniref:hypothetical protein n=1 Tax=Bradyrhizobium tropiciagri TaxID=312253 RepID=UPI001BACC501|nr:hypothetical protein [Bradyrhizobium tropiciagri]MBR0899439.1 hypothetical protein [Bradyrhizobium tropiciagri]
MSTEFDASGCLEIYESRVRLAIFAALGIVMTAGAMFMAGACVGVLLGFLGPPAKERALVGPILAFLIGTAGIILFGSITIHALVRWLGPRQPVLFMTRDGFKDIRISADWIPWSTVLSLKNYRDKGIVIDVDPDFVRKHLRLGPVARFMRTANGLFGNRGLWVVAFPLGISARELLDVMANLYRPAHRT